MRKNNQPICEADQNGTKCWFLNDHLHRENGPAVEWINGDKSWFLHGQRHRLDGPAVEWACHKYWYYHGKYIPCDSQEEFKKLINLKALW